MLRHFTSFSYLFVLLVHVYNMDKWTFGIIFVYLVIIGNIAESGTNEDSGSDSGDGMCLFNI